MTHCTNLLSNYVGLGSGVGCLNAGQGCGMFGLMGLMVVICIVQKFQIFVEYLNHKPPYVCINKNPLITLVGFQGVVKNGWLWMQS